MRLPFIGSMPSATCLCFVAILTLTSVFLPTLSQVTTNKSHTQMAKRSLSSFVGESSSMRGSTINWRFSLGHTNAAHTGLGPSTPKPTRQNSGNRTSWRPKVTIIGDNLAVNLSWPSRSSRQRPLSHYRIQFRYRDPHRRHWVRTPVVVQTRLAGNVLQPYLYVTNKQPGGLEAGKVYQFQVVAVLPDANAPEEKSRWSAITSFEYIYADSPLVRVARRLPDGTVLINWSRSWGQNAFRITRFIILFRKEKRLPNGETVFHGFRHVTAPGNLEEYKVAGLDRSAGYQFVVYGENTPQGIDPAESLFTGGLNGRKITTFSQEVFVPADDRAVAAQDLNGGNVGGGGGAGGGSLSFNNQLSLLEMNSSASNSLMFLILGVLAGAMLIVMIFLVAICFFRQRKEKLRLLAQINADDKDSRMLALAESNGNVGVDEEPPRSKRSVPSSGFLLADLTPIAVANFRTAPAPPPPPLPPVAGERDRLLPLSQPPPPPPSSPPTGDGEHHPTGSSTPSDSSSAIVQMKREPPSGGSIHDESDDNHEKNRNELTVSGSSPNPEDPLFARIALRAHAYPLYNSHLRRRPPSPPLHSSQHQHQGEVLAMSTQGRWLSGRADQRGRRLGKLSSHSFMYPSSAAWCYRRGVEAVYPFLKSISPPPQRIQAIVPQAGDKTNREEEFLGDIQIGVRSPRIHAPLGQQSSSFLEQTSFRADQPEEADAWMQISSSNCSDGVRTTSLNKKRKRQNCHPEKTFGSFYSSFSADDSRTDNLSCYPSGHQAGA
uniref:Fibronectin type-III domain-containing protein n=1 Tax=Mesocestoides corti TaxID=53468 RepID=A0A5K3ER76_MESCO